MHTSMLLQHDSTRPHMHTSVLLQHYSTRPHTAYHCVVTVATYSIPVCCYGMITLGHILHTSVLLQWPHTAYHFVFTSR